MIYTRPEYLAGLCSHRDYYAQFVTEGTRRAVARTLTLTRLKRSTDPDFNDIPLTHWDAVPKEVNSEAIKKARDYLTQVGWVCIAKEAATQLLEKEMATR
jgi:hypothetical protein